MEQEGLTNNGNKTGAEKSIEIWQKTAAAEEIKPYYYVWARWPVLDAVYYARIALKNAVELQAIEQLGKQGCRLQSLFFVLPIPQDPATPSTDFVFSDAYFDTETGLFRIFPFDVPTLLSIDQALRIVGRPDSEVSVRVGKLRFAILPSCVQFVVKCFQSKDSGYALRPKQEPTTFSNYVAISLISNYFSIRSYVAEEPLLEFHLHDVVHAILKGDFMRQSNGTFGFSQQRGGKLCLSATDYVYRLALMLENILGKDDNTYRELRTFLTSKSTQVIELIRRCYDSDSGGFRSYPEGDSAPSCGYIRSALHLLRSLALIGCLQSDDITWLDSHKIAGFMLKCWSEFGFANVPGDMPTLCAERAVLNSFKLLELFRLTGLLKTNGSYRESFTSAFEKLDMVPTFVNLCKDNQKKVCYEYPITVIRSWNYPVADIMSNTKKNFNWPREGLEKVWSVWPNVMPSQREARDAAHAQAMWWYKSTPLFGLNVYDIDSTEGKEILARMEETAYQALVKHYNIMDDQPGDGKS